MNQREAIGAALRKAMLDDDRVVLLGEDICDPYGGAFKVTQGLSTEFPNRVINTPISEGGLAGFASGAALRGLNPVLEVMFADFMTLCADQLINHASKFHAVFPRVDAVPMTIRAATGGYRGYGPTHSQSIEKLFFGFPGMSVVAPSEFHDLGESLAAAIHSSELALFFEHKLLYDKKVVDIADNARLRGFRVTRSTREIDTVVLSSCDDDEAPMVTILTYGGIASLAFEAALEVMLDEEITCELVIPAIVKPLSLNEASASLQRSGRVLVVEEGHVSWGWGAEVAARISVECFTSLRAPIRRVGARDESIPCSRALENTVLPQVQDLVSAICELVQN